MVHVIVSNAQSGCTGQHLNVEVLLTQERN